MRGRIILVRPFFFTRLPLGFGVFIPVAQAFRGDEEKRNEENAKSGGRDHAAEDRRADGAAAGRPGPDGDDQRQ